MNALSASFINPKLQVVSGRLKGTICPYRGGRLGQKPLHNLGKMMKSALDSTSSTDVIGYKTHDTKFSESYGTPWEYTYVFTKNDEGNLETCQVDFRNELNLQITISLSFILAICVCLVGAFKFYQIVMSISMIFFGRLSELGA